MKRCVDCKHFMAGTKYRPAGCDRIMQVVGVDPDTGRPMKRGHRLRITTERRNPTGCGPYAKYFEYRDGP